jgi:hypothetical protein
MRGKLTKLIQCIVGLEKRLQMGLKLCVCVCREIQNKAMICFLKWDVVIEEMRLAFDNHMESFVIFYELIELSKRIFITKIQ